MFMRFIRIELIIYSTSKVDIVKVYIQGLSKRFERFKFGIVYVLIVKIRYNFTHK